MKRMGVLLMVVAFVATACNGAETSSTSTSTTSGRGTSRPSFDPNSVKFEAALEKFDGCDGVLAHYKAEALARVGPYGLEGGQVWWPWIAEAAVDGDAARSAPTAGAGGDFFSYSETNNQVTGVDEPDIVKTDGDIVVMATGDGRLTVVDAASREVVGSVALDGWDHRLFLVGDTVVVFGRSDGGSDLLSSRVAGDSIWPGGGIGLTTVQVFDLANGRPRLQRTIAVEGNFLSARAIDGTVRLVISSYPDQLPFVYPSNEAAEDAALAANRAVVESSTLDDWLPNYTVLDADGDVVDEGLWVDCGRMHHPVEFAGFDALTVATLSDFASDTGDATGVVARGETVYSSFGSLYVATNVWVPAEVADTVPSRFDEEYSTSIHKFDITGDAAEYKASGSVDGSLLNQFAMDEFDGNLRVATTQGAPWGFREDSESFITVLEERDGELVEVGRVGDMGKGERIFSVRFVETVAYVVTFRQVDPLYVVDLADPEAPAVTGELKIPGYSAYLHPLGGGLILGVGQDADDDGVTRGAKVALFDVSDPTAPVEVSTWIARDASTEAEWNHLAFLYWADTDAMVMPLSSWSDGFFGAVVLNTEGGLSEQGRFEHAETAGGVPDCDEIDPADLGADFYEPGMTIQVCGEDELPGKGGHYCEPVPVDELQWWFEGDPDEIAAALDRLIDDDETASVCWPEHGREPIQRAFVIGDGLWTLTYSTLQVNDLATLDTIATIDLN